MVREVIHYSNPCVGLVDGITKDCHLSSTPVLTQSKTIIPPVTQAITLVLINKSPAQRRTTGPRLVANRVTGLKKNSKQHGCGITVLA